MTRWDWIGLFDVYMMIFWCVTYIECIRIGKQQKTYCMPLLALCMNFCWETLSLIDYTMHGDNQLYIYLIYGAWTLLDVGIVVTYIVYGNRENERTLKGRKSVVYNLLIGGGIFFIVRSLGVFVGVALIILIMYRYIDNWKAYIVFPNNLVMSIQFFLLPFIRKGSRGQSMSIAVTKCIGTLCATLTIGLARSVISIPPLY